MNKVDKCFYCGSQSLAVLVRASDFMITGEEFSVVRCISCSFAFTNPRPDDNDIGRYYQSEDYISHNDQAKGLMGFLYRFVRKYMLRKKCLLLTKILPDKKEPKLLDYGCGTGEFLARARREGFRTFGVEPDKNARTQAKEKGLYIADSLNQLANRSKIKKFDIITLWHVLEHIPDINQILIKFNDILPPDGLIVVAVPEYKCYDASFYGKYWAAWDLPRHLNHFDQSSLINWFDSNGFSPIAHYPMWYDAIYISLLSERYKKSGLFGMLRGICIGFWSNFIAFFTLRPFSSQIYVFQRKS